MKNNYSKLLLLNYSFIVILELLFKFFVIKSFDVGILYILVSSLFVSSVLTSIMTLINNKIVNRIISVLIYVLLVILFGAETVYYSFYKTICGVGGLSYGGQVMDFYTSIIEHIIDNSGIILLSIVFLIITIIINFKIDYKMYFKIAFVLLISTFNLNIAVLEISIINNNKANELMYETNDIMQSTNMFGVITGIVTDAVKSNIGFEEKIEILDPPQVSRGEEKEYNVLDIDFDELMENEHNSTIKNMHAYFQNETPSNKNEYTGIFKGKNLIFMVAEGFSPIAVDEKLTPTLYKLVNSSFVFENYYQPLYNCSTSDGEFISQLSLLPGVRTCSMKATEGVYFPYSLGNVMDKYNYKTYGIHGWTYSYYRRDITMPNLGYEYYGYDRYKKGYKYALSGIKDSWPTSDVDVIKSSYPIISKSSPFMAYYMTISGHLPYNFTGGNAMSNRNRGAVSNLDADDSIKAYIASQIELDKSLKLLIDDLKSDNILDDTVIVLTADHYPYGLSNDDIESYVDWMKNPNFDLYKNNLIIYNSGIETTKVSKYTSSLDILPTILNMFGVEYDSRLLMGRDIFSESDDLIIFNNKSWITNKGRYDYLKHEYESFDGNYDQDYIDKINKIVDNKFKMSKLIITNDYYRKLGGL